MTDPSTISGLTARYRADSISGLADGAAVASWPDTSGGAYTATQSTSAAQPTWKSSALGGQPTVRFASGQSLTSSAPAGDVAQTVVAVLSFTPASPGTIRGSAAAGGLQVRVYNVTPQLLKENIANIATAGSTLTSATPTVLTSTYDSNAYAFYINGTAAGTGTAAQTLTATGTAIGRNGATNGEFFIGDIAELLVWNRVLTSSERGTVESYVQDRYGVTVSDYTASAPTGSGSPAYTGAGTATTSSVASMGGTSAYTGSGTVGANGSATTAVTTSYVGAGTLSSSSAPQVAGLAGYAGTGALTTQPSVIAAASASAFSVAAALSAGTASALTSVASLVATVELIVARTGGKPLRATVRRGPYPILTVTSGAQDLLTVRSG